MYDAVEDSLQAIQAARAKVIKACMLAADRAKHPDLWETLVMLETTLRVAEHFARRAHDVTLADSVERSHSAATPSGSGNVT